MRFRLNDDGSHLSGEVEVKKEAPTVENVPVKETENVLTCDQCGFESKSSAGLAVHKMKHKTEQHED